MPKPEASGVQSPGQKLALRPQIIMFFGLTASGKSTVAKAWAALHGAPHYNTDCIRKELAGLAATEHRPDGVAEGIYAPQMTERTYACIRARSKEALQQGASMLVLDGSYSQHLQREYLRQLAQQCGAELYGVFCYCNEEEVKRRLGQRALDPLAVSDGRWEIYVYQKKTFDYPKPAEQGIIELDTADTVAALLATLHERLLAARTKRSSRHGA